jgi:fatty-acyl-CoA synthase
LPYPRWGETGAAYIVARSGVATDEQELIAWCESQLARFKVPRYIRFIVEIPRSSAAKVLRRELLQHWISEQPARNEVIR